MAAGKQIQINCLTELCFLKKAPCMMQAELFLSDYSAGVPTGEAVGSLCK